VAVTRLAMELAATVRHDGRGGVADDLADLDGFGDWLREHADLLGEDMDVHALARDEDVRQRVVAMRRVVRSLFARVVRPAPPSGADAHRLLDAGEALRELNAAAGAVLSAPRLEWPDDARPRMRHASPAADPATALIATVARATIEFLASADSERLRACPAPRCVRYFLQEHPQQAWCKPSCGNRARVARYHQRHRGR
jgi:predicted RNA-binding Zn ribbon-like protein